MEFTALSLQSYLRMHDSTFKSLVQRLEHWKCSIRGITNDTFLASFLKCVFKFYLPYMFMKDPKRLMQGLFVCLFYLASSFLYQFILNSEYVSMQGFSPSPAQWTAQEVVSLGVSGRRLESMNLDEKKLHLQFY